METAIIESPIGNIRISADQEGLTELRFRDQPLTGKPKSDVLAVTVKQLQEYFAGKRQVFDLPLNPQGTDFQRQVWRQLLSVEFGDTTSYGDIAKTIGKPTASRAVGAANGQNPISIIVPCHRIIGSSGKLTGYAGGLERKQWLLNHEYKTAGGVEELF
ncbi:methylated-DNA--[protein]-cysteine S-methyltransferase [Porticoccus sp. W117]|uniref:methylated-DNA--[protein]-cysteine S-methyltransferase n=1 Tax=Porticoccus sp. W117 TaxID=3054777 RepID=UPI002596D300|nr:methylated-DNA--[protein]-cysteine S-methyltransferase [Porticoccus sp. W117]MDM3870904.1 methylated-DNA--[protein]-cysteine S-methyltransferase [Porticoccus sp. W117]